MPVDNNVTLETKCVCCSETYSIIITDEQHMELVIGRKKIQDILPNHTPAERELLISGICGKCFDEMFAE